MNIPLELKRPKAKASAIMSRFSRNGVALKLYTGKTISTENWSKKGTVLSGETSFKSINKYLEVWQKELSDIIEDLEAKKIRLANSEIQDLINKSMNKDTQKIDSEEGGEGVVDFTSFMEDFVKQKESDGKFLQKLEQAQKTVLLAFNLVRKNDIIKYNSLNSNKKKSLFELKAITKLPFSEIDIKFIQKFKKYLNEATYKTKEGGKEVDKHYTTNYIDKQINGLKQFINGAIEAKYVQHFTWDSVKSNGTEVDTIHTDFDQIQAINDVFLDKPNEKKIRDSYVINCFLGFRYSDFSRLQPHVFKWTNVKGEKLLIYSGRNKKTGELIEFPIHPIAAAKLEEYNFQIPKYSAKEYNEIIKIVAKKAGFTQLITISETRAGKTTFMDIPMYELISSHTGRRSFCTNFYVEGIAIAIIMSISGHKTEKEFMKYIKKRSVRLEVAAEQISAIKGIKLRKVA